VPPGWRSAELPLFAADLCAGDSAHADDEAEAGEAVERHGRAVDAGGDAAGDRAEDQRAVDGCRGRRGRMVMVLAAMAAQKASSTGVRPPPPSLTARKLRHRQMASNSQLSSANATAAKPCPGRRRALPSCSRNVPTCSSPAAGGRRRRGLTGRRRSLGEVSHRGADEGGCEQEAGLRRPPRRAVAEQCSTGRAGGERAGRQDPAERDAPGGDRGAGAETAHLPEVGAGGEGGAAGEG